MPVLMNHARRLRSLRGHMKREGVAALLVTKLADVRYLCGFTGSNAALGITAHRASMFTDGRYTAQAKQETRAARVVIARKSAQREACAWMASAGVDHCAFDPASTTVADLDLFQKAVREERRSATGRLRSRGFFKPLSTPLMLNLREIKDEDELKVMEQAAHLGVKLFQEILPHIRSGTAEAAIAARLESGARLNGADGMSFETIVASGPRSALPHGRATTRPLPRRGFVTLDFGVILNGYCSDMTRTVFLGKPTRRERFTYDSVREAQQAAVAAVKPGVSCGEIDEAARGTLRKAGLAQYFTHSTGHGVGLEIHEAPRIADAQQQLLLPGMVITIEPGVYVAGRFGVRIEDTVVVTQQGAHVITPASTAWMQL
jgi:Xaa-Pro aminopeptidase